MPPGMGPLWSLHVLSVHILDFSGYLGFLPQTKNMNVRLTAYSKLSLGEGESGYLSCLSLCAPVVDLQLVQGVLASHTGTAGDKHQLPATQKRKTRKDNGWMVGEMAKHQNICNNQYYTSPSTYANFSIKLNVTGCSILSLFLWEFKISY